MPLFPDAKILDVNLTTGEIGTTILPGELYRLYPGGSALGAYLLMREGMDPNIDPYSPEALIAFSVSPFTGLPVAGSARLSVTAKSPLTGCLGDAQMGGFFPAHLHLNGWDSILFRGASEKPVYLYIENDFAELRDASFVWGKYTLDTERAIKAAIGDEKVEIAEIGPGGENLIRFACITTSANRAAGRNGLGAVMGSKKLKAIVAKRQPPSKLYDREKFLAHFGNAKARVASNAAAVARGTNGTANLYEPMNNSGYLITRNWHKGHFENGNSISGHSMTREILVKADTCYGCAIHCKRAVSVPEKGVIPEYGGPEYETCCTFGSYCCINDLGDVALGSQLCNMFGVDTISMGASIAFAMECFENGLLTSEMADGMELKFGDGSTFPEIFDQVIYRKTEFGRLLAEGSYRASLAIGNGAEAFFMGVKGQEFPAHMPQYKRNLGLHYSVNTFGADHMSTDHDPNLLAPPDSEIRRRLALFGIWKGYTDTSTLDDEKVRYTYIGECLTSAIDTVCLCMFAFGTSSQLYGFEDIVVLAKTALGVDLSLAELLQIGERKITMSRYFNYMAGIRPEKDDTLPERIFKPIPDGPAAGAAFDKEAWLHAKQVYYQIADSDPVTGRPSDALLKRMSLQWMQEVYRQ